MKCSLCLELILNTEESIEKNSPSWNDLYIENIIEKHLWPMTSFKNDPQWLCNKCWRILDEFHKFYLHIENVQRNYEDVIKSELNTTEVLTLNSLEPIVSSSGETEKFILETTNNRENCKHEDDDIFLIDLFQNDLSEVCKHNNKTGTTKDPLINQKKKHNVRNVIKAKLLPASGNNVKKSISDKIKNSKNISNTSSPQSTDQIKNPKNISNTSSHLLIAAKDNHQSVPSYYYESNMSVCEYDDFIRQHFNLTCCKCQRTVMTFPELHQHFQEEHKNKQGYVMCCGKQFRKRGMLVNHINLHLNPEYFKCEYCNEVSPTRTDFKIHKKSHENVLKIKSQDKIYKCVICNKKFKNKGLLHSHKLTHVPEEDKKFACPECNKNFAREYMLASHQRVVHLKTYSKLCEICGDYFSKVESFERHMAKHKGIPQTKFCCDICGRVMISKHCLSVHMKSIHPEDGKHDYICHICHKVYPNKIARREHIRRVHQTGLIYKCNICEKAFKRKEYLKDHVATHTGVGLPTCPYCSKTFNSNSTMHQHRKKAHPKEWQEARNKKYSGKLPSNSKSSSTETNEPDKSSLTP